MAPLNTPLLVLKGQPLSRTCVMTITHNNLCYLGRHALLLALFHFNMSKLHVVCSFGKKIKLKKKLIFDKNTEDTNDIQRGNLKNPIRRPVHRHHHAYLVMFCRRGSSKLANRVRTINDRLEILAASEEARETNDRRQRVVNSDTSEPSASRVRRCAVVAPLYRKHCPKTQTEVQSVHSNPVARASKNRCDEKC